MCGIGGYYLRSSKIIDTKRFLQNVLDAQRHRGPDAEGVWEDSMSRVGFCHSRLSILDLRSTANQPMHSANGCITLTFNGEIYNWKELRRELQGGGASFRTNSDTEVIIAAYREWGCAFIERLHGMYAIALFDQQKKEMLLARDHIGKKPLIYAESESGFAFCSEISALRRWPEIDLSIDQDALGAMILHNMRHIPEPGTIFQGIKKLRPGHAIIVRDGRIKRMWRYWTPRSRKVASQDELRTILEEAVAIRCIADVPVGALLSGGVDSTAIVNLMRQYLDEPVRTYAFGVDRNDEDLRRARFMARRLGTRHKEFYFNPARQLEVLKKILATYGEPIMLLPLVHAFELSKAISDDGIKVVLNGNGADELFYGYTGHIKTARVTRLINLLSWARYILPEIKHTNLSIFFSPPGKRKAALYRNMAKAYWPMVFKPDAIDKLENIVSQEMVAWGTLIPNHDYIDESNYLALLVENSHSLTIASDLPAMMASVEMRSPFLDQEVIAAAMSIPFSRKVKGPKDGSKLKYVLRKAVSDLMPQEIINAPKRGFGMGVQEKDVLLGPWRSQADEIFDEYPEMGVFDTEKVRTLWRDAKKYGSSSWSLLAKMFSIGLWRHLN